MFASKDLMFGQQSGGYQISRSVRTRASASAYFNRTIGTPTNNKICTLSFWAKRGALQSAGSMGIIATSGGDYIDFNNDNMEIRQLSGGGGRKITTAVFRDPSAWYHFVFQLDTTDATAANRIKIWQNGVQLTSFSTSSDPSQNSTWSFNVASAAVRLATDFSSYFDGYLTEMYFIDGQSLAPTSFGAFDAVTGVWNPKKYSGTYGTNGFYLNFSDNSGATATTIGKDSSGNGNNWTPNNISVTAGTTYDSMVDSPTNYGSDTGAGGEVRGNYCVLNPIDNRGGNTTSDGNLKVGPVAGTWKVQPATIAVSSGKWYFEAVQTVFSNGGYFACGFVPVPTPVNSYTNLPSSVASAQGWSFQLDVNSAMYFWYNYTTAPQYVTISSGFTTSDVAQIAVDIDAGKIWVGKNNTWYDSSGGTTGNPTTGANPTASNLSGTIVPFLASGNTTPTGYANFGQRAFSYTAPSGFKALCTQNLPTPTISNGANYMAASLYTGTGASQTVSNAVNSISFQPDMVWIKSRSAATDNKWTDSVRGVTKGLVSNTTAAETTDTNGLTAFGTTGFTVGSDTNYNNSGATYVGWQWKASGSTVSNTAGSITSTVSANTTAGFSILTYTGTGATATIGHGLGVAPSMMIMKKRSNAGSWKMYHASLGNTKIVEVNDTGAAQTSSTYWNNTSPTSTLITVGSNGDINASGETYVSYCWTAISGYSAFGSFVGNGVVDGPFIYLGFRPRYVLVKVSTAAANWAVIDSSRDPYNVMSNRLLPNSALNEAPLVDPTYDFLANGFKLRTDNATENYSGQTIIYAAFAENPFTIARAR